MEQGRCTAIVLAAGQGKRMHSKISEAVSGNRREAGSVLFPALFSGESADPGYYSGDGGRDDFLL